MTIYAQYIVHRAAETLQDLTSIRWPAAELVRYLNDGQREIGFAQPEAVYGSTQSYALAAGANQMLPSEGNKLITVRCNGGGGPAIRLTSMEILDAQIPNWRSITPASTIVHYMYDERTPRLFHVYPPAASGATVDLSYSKNPVDIAEPSTGATWAQVDNVTPLSVIDLYANVLVDYILHRAYAKDAEYAQNAQLSAAYYQAFASALGIERSATVSVSPKGQSAANPNVIK